MRALFRSFGYNSTRSSSARRYGTYLGGAYGNPSSLHLEGKIARQAVDEARAQVAALIGAQPDEIIFTGSGTESDNLALIGALHACGKPGHVVTSAIEHAALA